MVPSVLQVPILFHLHTGAMMGDLAVDQHSTWMDQCSTTLQRLHSDHQDTIQNATPDNLHHF